MNTSHDNGRGGDDWEGVVTGLSRGMLDGSNMYHFVEVRLADGACLKVRIGRRLWKSLKTGDRVAKRAGADPAKA
ncbi:hypothetical protein ACGFXC_26905 [Streptomyces sp. NPDC048507]|uniref:DUF7489 domain-containing protein n=1 Tax=Streptomyces sp. NPDC048507 TaxID=3365560 RepID=UPI003712DC32